MAQPDPALPPTTSAPIPPPVSETASRPQRDPSPPSSSVVAPPPISTNPNPAIEPAAIEPAAIELAAIEPAPPPLPEPPQLAHGFASAPPLPSSDPSVPRTQLPTIRDDATAAPLHGRPLKSLVLSAAAHAGLFVLLAMWMLPADAARRALHMVVGIESEETLDDVMLDASIALDNAALNEASEPELDDLLPELPTSEPDVMTPDTLSIDSIPTDLLPKPLTPEPTGSEADSPAPPSAPPSVAAPMRGAQSVAGAVDQVTSRIRSKLSEGNLLVVWLLDASHSLVDDRQRVAERLTPFYEELAAGREDGGYQLRNAVVSFGAKISERVPPRPFGPEVANAVKKLRIDPSGKEMVFQAVQNCVDRYQGQQADESLMIVVWTDETGDDSHLLEPTIAKCRQAGAAVFVVGPSSVLGANTGLHSYADPKTRRTYQLPVERGPDAATPERLAVDYWFANPSQRTQSWMGGPQLAGIASGLSPYALTRLAIQTGGQYTIFDRRDDRGPFDFERLRAYQPSYVSAAEYEREIQSRPLRQAVMEAVRLTQASPIAPPRMQLFGSEVKGPGGTVQVRRMYYPPAQFAVKVRTARRGLVATAKRISDRVDAALDVLNRPDLASAYEKETPRWRAWHDLTKGRLLAVSVRLEEYRLTCEQLGDPGALNPATNWVEFIASSRMQSDSTHHQRAQEAERLLMRCAREHAGTPWSVLAKREMQEPLGVGIRQATLRLVRGVAGGGGGRAPSLPNF